LKAKERELTGFMDAFPQRRAAKQAELTAKQEAIVALLQHLTDLQAGAPAPAAAAADGPPGGTASASVTAARMSLSAAAAAALAGGSGGASGGSSSASIVAAKRAELQKLEELEGKISVELQALREQLEGLQGEVDTYADVEGAKRAKEEARETLERQQQELQAQHESLQVSVYVCWCCWHRVLMHASEGIRVQQGSVTR
jgi:Skp family chaperone for outer membrane proteins